MARVILGTVAVEDPDLVREAARAHPGRVAVGLDARGGQVATRGWAETTEIEAVDLARRFEDAGVAAIIYTDIDRDGAMGGPNVAATAALARAVSIPVIASGGVSSLADLVALRDTGVIAGAISGRALYDGRARPRPGASRPARHRLRPGRRDRKSRAAGRGSMPRPAAPTGRGRRVSRRPRPRRTSPARLPSSARNADVVVDREVVEGLLDLLVGKPGLPLAIGVDEDLQRQVQAGQRVGLHRRRAELRIAEDQQLRSRPVPVRPRPRRRRGRCARRRWRRPRSPPPPAGPSRRRRSPRPSGVRRRQAPALRSASDRASGRAAMRVMAVLPLG